MPAVSNITAAVTIDRQDCVALPFRKRRGIHAQHIIDPSIGIDCVQKAAELRELCVKRTVRRIAPKPSRQALHRLEGHKARMHPKPMVLKIIRRGQRSPGLLIQRSRNIADFCAVVAALDPWRIDCDGDDIVLRHCVGLSLHFQVPVASAVAAIVILPVRVQLFYVFHRRVENLRHFFQRICRVTERHAPGGPGSFFALLQQWFMRRTECVVRHRAVCTAPPIVKRHLIIHRHRRRGRRGRGGRRLRRWLCRGRGRFRRHRRCRNAVRRGGGAGGEQKGKRGKNYSVLFHDTHLLLKAPAGADACIGPQALP